MTTAGPPLHSPDEEARTADRPRVLLVTDESHASLSPSDSVLARALEDEGLDPVAAIWTSEDVEWREASAVILRSAWDYHRRPAEFARWLDRLESLQVVVWNSVRWVRATMTKTYLLDLAGRGWPVVPTTLVRAGSVVDSGLIAGHPAAVVVKPLIGASAWSISIVNAGASLRVVDDVLVQPFLPEIAAGEWAVIAIDGRITHSVLKIPAGGDFRVQRDHGGSAVVGTPPPAVAELAGQIVTHYLTPDILYARIDIVVTQGGPLVMEIELIEPELFFDLVPGPARAMARAVAGRLRAEVTR